MKSKLAIIVALLLAASSCVKEMSPAVSDTVPSDATFTADASFAENPGLRTSLVGSDTEGYDVVWKEGDGFRLLYKYGKHYSYWGYLTYALTSGDGRTSASFATADSFKSEDFSEPSISFFPASLVPDGIEGGSTTATGPLQWPSVQHYVAGTASDCPMFSDNTDPSGTFVFKNLGGVLRLRVKGSGSLSAIRVSAEQKMSGEFDAYQQGDTARISMSDGKALSYISLECPPEGVQLTGEGVDFHINLPPGSYTSFAVEFYDGDLLIGTRRARRTVVIERSKITPAEMTAPSLEPGRLLHVGEEVAVSQEEMISFVSGLSPEIAEMADFLPLLIMTDLHLFPVLYSTTDVDGKVVAASGLVAYPTYAGKNEAKPLCGIVSIQHGTCDIDEAPSTQRLPMEMLPVAAGRRTGTGLELLISSYFVGCMADYLGYGATVNDDLLHPYLHNRLTGSCCADLISATAEFVGEKGLVIDSDNVDLVGYSQGGAATISTMLELLRRDEQEWTSRLGGIWAGAGPYDIPAFMSYFADKESYSRSCYIPYALRGLAYGSRLHPDWDRVYNSPVGSSLKTASELENSLFSKTQVSTWTDVIGVNVKDILHPDFYLPGYNSNNDIISLAQAAAANSVADPSFAPSDAIKAKIKLYHSIDDDTVPYACSESLFDNWALEGVSPEITVLGHSDHVQAGVDFLLDFCGLGGLMSDLAAGTVNIPSSVPPAQ